MEAVGAEKGGGCPVDGSTARGTAIPSQSTQTSEASESAPEAVVTESRSVESLWEELSALKGVLDGEQTKQEALEIGTGQLDVGNRRKMVAKLVEGKSNSLESLTTCIALHLFGSGDSEHRSTARNLILDVASRKYYGAKADLCESINTFEDETLTPFWFWESRVLSDLPDELRFSANVARKKRKDIRERINAIIDLVRVLEDLEGPKKPSEAKIKRAYQKLSKTQQLVSILEECRSKEDGQAQKVAEKLKRSQDIVTERAVKSVQKAVEKETKAAEALGFGSKKSLSKAQNMLKNFAVSKPPKGTQNESQHETKLDDGNLYRRFTPCPPNKRMCFTPCDPVQMDALDLALSEGISEVEVRSNFSSICKRWNETKRSSILGIPPSWARKPDCPQTFHELALREYGEGYYADDICVRRHKYLWFPCDSECPPYYGSCVAKFQISPIKPFVKNPFLDYEEDFDDGWEEEPEGESLSADEEGEDEVEDKESQDGFVVDDGYLSEDEGLQELDLEGLTNITDNGVTSVSLSTTEQSEKQKILLYTLLEHARKSGKPVVVSRLTSDSAGGAENAPTFSSTANRELLQCLRLRRSSLENVELPSINNAAKPSSATEKKNFHRGRSKQSLSSDLTADLIELLRTSPSTKDKVVEAFLQSHPESKVSKSCIRDKIAELCEYNSLLRIWVLKADTQGNGMTPNNTQEDMQSSVVAKASCMVTASSRSFPTSQDMGTFLVSAIPGATPMDAHQSVLLSRKRPLGTDAPVAQQLNPNMLPVLPAQAVKNRAASDLMDEDARTVG